MTIQRTLVFILASCLVGVSTVFAYDIPAKAIGYVNDYADIISPSTQKILEDKLSLFASQTFNEIVVVTVPDLGTDDTIETLGIKIADKWKVGNEKEDNGVILLIARDNRKARIEVGYGLEGVLTDSVSAQILQNDIFPSFKKGDYEGGILSGVEHIMGTIEGQVYMREGSTRSSNLFTVFKNNFELFIFGGFWLLIILAEFLARSRAWWQGGVIGLVLGIIFGLIFHSGLYIGLWALFLGLLGLLVDFILSRMGPFDKGGSGGIPFIWGGFGGKGGGFRGFGGGSFGGGGSSGSW